MWQAIGRDIYGRPIYDDRDIEDVEYKEVVDEDGYSDYD